MTATPRVLPADKQRTAGGEPQREVGGLCAAGPLLLGRQRWQYTVRQRRLRLLRRITRNVARQCAYLSVKPAADLVRTRPCSRSF